MVEKFQGWESDGRGGLALGLDVVTVVSVKDDWTVVEFNEFDRK